MTRAMISVFGLVLFFSTQLSFAEDVPTTIHSVGTSSKVFMPNVVRIRCRIFSEGVTGGSALKKLNASRDLLEKKLAGNKSNERSHTLGPIVEHRESQGTIQEFQMKAMQKMMGRGGDTDEDEEKFLRLYFTLTIEWQLSGENIGDQIGAIDSIRAELESLGLMQAEKKPDKDESSSDDDEAGEPVADEAAETTPDSAVGAKIRVAGNPVFSYLRRLSDEEMDAVAADAFKDARHRAERFAAAAGLKLGKLRQISNAGRYDILNNPNKFARASDIYGTSIEEFEEDDEKPDSEIVSQTFKPIAFRTGINATYSVE